MPSRTRLVAPVDTGTDREADARLVAQCRSGRDDAWAVLVERHERYVLAIPLQVFRLSQTEAEDVFQDAWSRAYEHLDRLRDPGAFRPWIAELTRRICIDRIRRGPRDEPTAEIELGAEEDAQLQLLDDALAVRAALTELPEHCQEILDRFFARDESYRTIAEALDLPPGTIASRISRCLTRLRSTLEGR